MSLAIGYIAYKAYRAFTGEKNNSPEESTPLSRKVTWIGLGLTDLAAAISFIVLGVLLQSHTSLCTGLVLTGAATGISALLTTLFMNTNTDNKIYTEWGNYPNLFY